MATNVGDILRCTHFHDYLGQECLNVFFYQVGVNGNPALLPFSFTDEYAADYETRVMAVMTDDVTLTRILWENLTNELDFSDVPQNRQGASTGDPAPSALALSVKLIRDSKITRNGSKRFVGLSEGLTNGNQVVLSQGITDNIEGFCGTNLFYADYDGQGNDIELRQVIIGRTLSAGNVYELDLSKVNQVDGAQVRNIIGTQNSRKP